MPYATLEEAKQMAHKLARFAKDTAPTPCAFEVVKTASGKLEVQPFGLHSLFKTHKLLHVEPIPKD